MSRKRQRVQKNKPGAEDWDDNRQALPISKTQPELMNGIPVSGEDYILLVRQQASREPNIRVAPRPKQAAKVNLPEKYRFDTSNEPLASHLLPWTSWQDHFALSFGAYQREKQQAKVSAKQPVPPRCQSEWFKYCYGSGQKPDNTLLDTVADLPQRTLIKLLSYHQEWLAHPSEAMFIWIYTLLVYLDPLMTCEDTAVLRDLARICIQRRNQATSRNQDDAIHLNVIITIIAKVFRQADLV